MPRDETTMAAIRQEWDAFQPFLDQERPPPLSDADTVVRQDEAWAQAAQEYVQAKAAAQASDEALERAKDALVALARYPREQGTGVAVTRFWKGGSVDYKRVPQLAGVDLEQYRGKGREEVRVSVVA